MAAHPHRSAASAQDTAQEPPMLSLRSVTKSFVFGEQSLHVLHGIDLEIKAGEMVAIVGQSGSGKSTLMNIMACLDVPSSGDYRLDGKSVPEMSKDELARLRRDRFGFIFQRYQLLGSLNAADNVAMPAIYAGSGKHERRQRAVGLLAKLGLQERTGHYPNQLSGGQQQRVSIARALMNGGQVIFADEPTGALDSRSSQDVMNILTELNRDGHTVILVTHDHQVARAADRILEIHDGRIIKDEVLRPSGGRLPERGGNPAAGRKTAKPAAFAGLFGGLKEALRMALLTMTANKMRTLLTMLGIIIGIASVVLIVALGNGSKQKILNEINSIGAATLTVSSGNAEDRTLAGTSPLSMDDMHALAQQPFVASVSPDLSMPMTAQVGNTEKAVQAEGVGISHHKLKNVAFVAGAMFGQADLDGFSQHIVISEQTQKALFPRKSALGEVVLLNGVPTRVVGVFKYKGIEGSYDRSLKVWLPYRTYQARFAGDSMTLNSITVLLKQGYSSALAGENISRILTVRHGKKDFTLFNSDSLTKTVEKTAQTLTLLIGAIAVISLLVGGIGVMNIMLVSVTERTGEIGVRMAVGATYKDIVQQFLIEAMVVCAIGGFFGVALAYGLGMLIRLFGVQVAFSAMSVALAVGCASLIGLVFGLMPAHRAATMNPIDALNKG